MTPKIGMSITAMMNTIKGHTYIMAATNASSHVNTVKNISNIHNHAVQKSKTPAG
jgi:hypothetical protein